MKLIELVREKEIIKRRWASGTGYEFGISYPRSKEKSKGIYTEQQEMVKRYTELCEKLNEAYARVKITVTGYGKITMATAFEFLRANKSNNLLFNQAQDVDFLKELDLQNLFTRQALNNLNASGCGEWEDDINSYPIFCRNYAEVNKIDRDELEEFKSSHEVNLKIELLKAMTSEEV